MKDADALRSTVASQSDERRPMPEPGDDFYCLRFRVWYASLDCAYRTRFRTCPGCLDCDQGRFNLKRHAAELVDRRGALRVLSR